MRIWPIAVVVVSGACADEGSPVNVHIAASGGEVAFEGIADVRRGEDGRWEGRIDTSGTVNLASMWQFGHDHGTNTLRLEGLRPGDEIEIADSPTQQLPADCTCAASSAPAVAIIVRTSSCGYPTCPPPQPNQGTTTTSLAVYREAAGAVPGPSDSLVRCSVTTWDALRQTVAAARCPVSP